MKTLSTVVVENNIHDLELLRDELREAFPDSRDLSLSVRCFLNPREAHDYIVREDCRYLFTGMDLIGTDGIRFSRLVRETRPDIGIVLTSPYEEHVLQTLEAGIPLHGYLSLPASPEAVRKVLSTLLTQTQNQKEMRKDI